MLFVCLASLICVFLYYLKQIHLIARCAHYIIIYALYMNYYQLLWHINNLFVLIFVDFLPSPSCIMWNPFSWLSSKNEYFFFNYYFVGGENHFVLQSMVRVQFLIAVPIWVLPRFYSNKQTKKRRIFKNYYSFFSLI